MRSLACVKLKFILQVLYRHLYHFLWLSVPITDTVKISILVANILADLIISTPLEIYTKINKISQ